MIDDDEQTQRREKTTMDATLVVGPPAQTKPVDLPDTVVLQSDDMEAFDQDPEWGSAWVTIPEELIPAVLAAVDSRGLVNLRNAEFDDCFAVIVGKSKGGR